MQILKWEPVKRKRITSIAYTDPEYVKGYDLDMDDFTNLVGKFNRNELNRAEEARLLDHVMTMMNIALENPKINAKGREELDELTDAMFMSGWGALKYIKDGMKPYSYIYRSMYTGACTFFKKKIKDREKAEAIDQMLREEYAEYLAEISDGKVRNVNPDYR